LAHYALVNFAYPALALLLIPTGASGANHARISTREMVAAIKRADQAQLNGVDAATVSVSSVRVIRCVEPDEEPTEFECAWQTRGKTGWINHKSRLAVDSKGWHFID
jgi:hypothetical protein